MLVSLTKREEMQFIQKIKTKIKNKLAKYPAYVKFLQVRSRVIKLILNALMAFFNAVGPVWNFVCTKTLNPGRTTGPSNEIS